LKQKSFLVIFIICGFFVLGIKNCYQGNYTINGQQVEGAMVALGVSKGMFNVVATAAMIFAALFSMRILKRERGDGTQSTILSKSVSRYEYIIGKAAGLWIVTFLFMFVLHVIIFTIGFIKTGEAMPGYLFASLLCSIDILFVVCFVMLLSLYLPDFACFIMVSALGLFSYIGDGIYSVSQNKMVQEAITGNASKLPDISVWKIIYFALPKLSTVQLFASSFISNESFDYAGPIHPLINIVLYCTISIGLLLVLFRKQDIA
jgi:ABC-type transport system involved in multi-copper enzyme maturation permease subunit